MGVVGAVGGGGVAAEQTREGNATRERERGEWEAEIIVEITYEARLRAGETRGNRIEREEGAKEEDARARRLFPRDFLIIYRARVLRSPLSRGNGTAMRFRELRRGPFGIANNYRPRGGGRRDQSNAWASRRHRRSLSARARARIGTR